MQESVVTSDQRRESGVALDHANVAEVGELHVPAEDILDQSAQYEW
ncbi:MULTISPECIES: hypothetical protein [unclassified Crossiella]|nr:MULTISPECIES: hypothetical protein [unclassified Crossiella]MCK2238986.1 hypothetical protein [Crossiella sp. S99.2]MCK2251445.1 hypothetical protein [Crossiella sp. S99.1]